MWTHDKHIIHGPGDLWFGITCYRTHDGDLWSTCEGLILGHHSDFGRFCRLKENTQNEMPVMSAASSISRFADLSPPHLYFINIYLFCTSRSLFMNNNKKAAVTQQTCSPRRARNADPVFQLSAAQVVWDQCLLSSLLQSPSSPWKTDAGWGWDPKAWLCTPQAWGGPQRALVIQPKVV